MIQTQTVETDMPRLFVSTGKGRKRKGKKAKRLHKKHNKLIPRDEDDAADEADDDDTATAESVDDADARRGFSLLSSLCSCKRLLPDS